MQAISARNWLDKGQFHTINGHKVFVIDSADGEDPSNKLKPYLCILHGFPTSSYDYYKVIDELSKYYRVIIHDHLGFGYSDKPLNYSYSFIDQTDISLRLWQSLNIQSATILAHDYGTSILTELLARDNAGFCPINIQQIVLCNGSIHIELAKLRIMQRLLRLNKIGPLIAGLSNQKIMAKNLKNIYADPTRLSTLEIDAIWTMMTYNHGKKIIAKTSRYTYERMQLWHRWVGALQATQLPIEIIWPDKDPVAVAEMALVIHAETQNSRLYWLKNCGHFPMLEAPYHWSKAVLKATCSD